MTEEKSNRKYKDGMFRKLFNNKEKILELYNAIEDDNITDSNQIEIRTLEDVIYNVFKNDLAFTVGDKFIIMIEHQSTVSVNIVLRILIYMARVYEKLMPRELMYRRKPVILPTPVMYVMYNGEEAQPKEQELRLSDLYAAKNEDVNLELKAKVININYEVGSDILHKSQTINDYSHFVYKVRENMKGGKDRDAAIESAIEYCIKADILKDFLEENGSEVYNMLSREFDVEEYVRVRSEESFEDGMKLGEAKGEARGKAEGKEEGKVIGMRELAKKLAEEYNEKGMELPDSVKQYLEKD